MTGVPSVSRKDWRRIDCESSRWEVVRARPSRLGEAVVEIRRAPSFDGHDQRVAARVGAAHGLGDDDRAGVHPLGVVAHDVRRVLLLDRFAHRRERDAEQEIFSTDRAASYPASDGKLTFDKLSSVFASGNKTRDDQPDHIVLRHDVPQELARLWERMA